MRIDRFDIDASGAANTSVSQIRLMLRALLADRFQLRFHRELRGNVEMFVIDEAMKP